MSLRAQDGLPDKWWGIEAVEETHSRTVADTVISTVNWLDKHQRGRHSQYIISSRLYGNPQAMSYWGIQPQVPAGMSWTEDNLKFNVCSSVVDTVTAKVAQEKPQAYFLTQRGDYQQQRRAKKLTQFCLGVFEQNRGHELAVRVFRDAAVLGDAFVEVFATKDKRITYKYVHAWEIFIDDAEALYGEPRQMYRRKACDRQVLIDLHPELEKQIRAADPVKFSGTTQTIGDNIWTYEAWHLPSSKKAEDGRHVICIQGAVLSDEEWTRSTFPFARLQWTPRMAGYWGIGLVEQVQSIQLQINKLLHTISRSIRLAGSFKWLIANGSKVVREHITNEVGTLIYYTGTEPKCVAPPVIQPEILQQYERLKRDAYEQAGVSAMAATAAKPAGLNSGVAIREYNDTATDRFSTIAGAFNDFHLELARQTIAVAREVGGGVEVSARDGYGLRSIKWSDVQLDEDAFVMRLFAISSLPEEPAGRLQQVTEWGQAGLLTPGQVKRLLGYPDTGAVSSLQQAAEDYINMTLDRLVEEDDYRASPDPLSDVQLAYQTALEFYNRGQCEGLEETKLEKLRRYINQAETMLEAANEPTQQPQNTSQPQANPQAPPTSDIVQNVPGQAAA